MDEKQLKELRSVRSADTMKFHGVLDATTLVESEEINFGKLLDDCRASIKSKGEDVHAILAHWDFPTSVLAPILAAEFGVKYPSLTSILKCEHKYWSRLEQSRVAKDFVPRFAWFDPFDETTGSPLDFPFWIKPIKSFSSQLGFLIENEEQFEQARLVIQKGIGRIGVAFNEALTYAQLPDEITAVTGKSCIAEGLLTGTQLAIEGSVIDGKYNVHGVLDMTRSEHGKNLGCLVYPSQAPLAIQETMIEISEKYLKHIGFDNGCFNAEFIWDELENRLSIIEFNTRISHSHSELFLMVDGMSNHEIALEAATGQHDGLPQGKGPCRVAAKFIHSRSLDGVMVKAPTPEAIAAIENSVGNVRIDWYPKDGSVLSTLPNQDAYHYVLCDIYIGANEPEELLQKYRASLAQLDYRITDLS
jgi:hypothetical protein|tara:strand:+ start:139143 stop:140393 length:1251 start_codon:yes stop_codon:yes gene_type:complete